MTMITFPALPALRYVLYTLFIASGFSGLIYESIWSHYLKLMLGHAAYAQTLVLAIFLEVSQIKTTAIINNRMNGK